MKTCGSLIKVITTIKELNIALKNETQSISLMYQLSKSLQSFMLTSMYNTLKFYHVYSYWDHVMLYHFHPFKVPHFMEGYLGNSKLQFSIYLRSHRVDT